MSALHPIATAKADIRKRSCPLYPQKRTCAVQTPMSALGQKRTFAVQKGMSDLPSRADYAAQQRMSGLGLRATRKQILSAQVVPSNIPSDFLHRRVFESLAQLTS